MRQLDEQYGFVMMIAETAIVWDLPNLGDDAFRRKVNKMILIQRAQPHYTYLSERFQPLLWCYDFTLALIKFWDRNGNVITYNNVVPRVHSIALWSDHGDSPCIFNSPNLVGVVDGPLRRANRVRGEACDFFGELNSSQDYLVMRNYFVHARRGSIYSVTASEIKLGEQAGTNNPNRSLASTAVT